MKFFLKYSKSIWTITVFLTFTIFACKMSGERIDDRVDQIIDQIPEPSIPDQTINLVEFSGHKPDRDGTYDFRNDIQRAVDLLAEQSGGTLLFRNSTSKDDWLRYQETFRIRGPIFLRNHTKLLIEPSVRLLFEFGPEHYLQNGRPVLTRYEGTTIYSFSPCLRAFRANDIVIEGTGGSGAMPVIDGDGEKWQRWMWEGEAGRRERGVKPAYQALKDVNNQGIPVRERVYADPGNDFYRPALMQFFLCKNIRIQGIKMTNSPFWCVHPVFSENVIIRDLLFDAYVVNNDGIDPESSRNVLIENIQFGNHDDNVAIKAGRDLEGREGADITGTELQGIRSRYIQDNRLGGAAENIVIRNCIFKGHYAIAIGSEMSGGVRHVYALDNRSIQDVNMGFFIKSSRTRGGVVENVYVRDLHLNRVDKDVISMVPNYDNDTVSPYPPVFRHIRIRHVSAVSAQNGIRLYGWHDAPVENVKLQHVKIDRVEVVQLKIEQSKNVVLRDVVIDGLKKDGHYTVRDSTAGVPHQI